MYPKLVILMICGVLVGAAMLHLRQQRLDMANQIIAAHTQIDRTRQRLWTLQAQITTQVEPRTLEKALVRSRLALEPDALQRPEVSKAQLTVADTDHHLTMH